VPWQRRGSKCKPLGAAIREHEPSRQGTVGLPARATARRVPPSPLARVRCRPCRSLVRAPPPQNGVPARAAGRQGAGAAAIGRTGAIAHMSTSARLMRSAAVAGAGSLEPRRAATHPCRARNAKPHRHALIFYFLESPTLPDAFVTQHSQPGNNTNRPKS
jgi:hypothetical protein